MVQDFLHPQFVPRFELCKRVVSLYKVHPKVLVKARGGTGVLSNRGPTGVLRDV